ncbi:MAG: PKD domain-containing protein [Bacteroidia bacterium]|nr:PKD domain-containing protein [Bacteroidia bacterium]
MEGKLLKRFLTALLITLCMTAERVEASHAMGADLTYQCMGGNTYKIRLSFYRDCIGINAPNNVFISITSASCGQNLGITCNPIPGTGQQVTPLCPSALSTCNGGTFTGIQEWVYEGIVTLPMQCTDWRFSYDLCCRNAAINTITNPGTSTFHIYATLNNTISPCNTSPVFSNKPVPFACLGQQLCFNHGAFDADGDSLVYQLITPYQTASSTVNYITPYNAINPLNSSPAVQFNTSTGDICMTPQQLQVTVMAVLVKEYRNGVLIGTVERDIQVTVISCNNQLPSLTGINGTNQYTATICANQPYCFNIYSSDPDSGQNVFISWDGGILGGTFTSTSAQFPVSTFCWTPGSSDIGTTQCFTALVHDDACPMNGTQVYSYCLTVVGVKADAGTDQLIACNDIATLYGNGIGGSGSYTYQWSTGSTNPGITVGAGTYILTVSDGMCSATDTVNVISAFEPTANFSASTACAGSSVQFTDLSTLPGGVFTSWNWNFGDGDSSNQQNPSHNYLIDGTYFVQLIVTTNLGCIDTVVIPVTIDPLPVVDFTVTNVCEGTAVNILNNTQPAGSSFNWNFGNGQSSNNPNPSVTYGSSGTYTITLTATTQEGCVDSLSAVVTVFEKPDAGFAFSPSGTCQGGVVSFTNTSTGDSTYTWNFGNGQTSTSPNPIVTYNSPGSYDVTLTVTSANGCTDSITHTVIVNPLPLASAGLSQTICIGDAATLIASGGISYQWSTGDSTDIISVSPSSNTTYTVTVTDANGCTATAQVNVTINPLPVPVVSPDQSVCIGQSVTLNASGGVSYYWNPSGNTSGSITVTPSVSTTYAVNVTDSNGCIGTGFINVTVNALPVVNLQNAFVCSGNSVNLDAGSSGTYFSWSTGDTTQVISVSSAGTYTVTVTSAAGCTASSSALISVGGSVINNLANSAFCQGDSAVLNAGNPGSTYNWSTGATSQSIVVYTSGTYSVTITDGSGCSGTVSTTVNVYPLPQAQFIPNDVCIGDSMFFMDVSTINSGTVTGWQWDFGDGNISQQQNPIHIYATPGTYAVTFTVTSDQGCVSNIVKSFNVFPLPVANFNLTNACVGTAVNLTNTSTVAVGNVNGWNYNFGDSTSSSQQNPSHSYLSPGVYNITLSATTNGGCRDTIIKQVTIYPLPVATFNANTACYGSPTLFTSTSSVPGGIIAAWQWSFGDTKTSVAQNPVHQYNNPGTYNVTLIVTSSNGCTATTQQTVTVNPLPLVNLIPDQTVCSGNSTQLNASGGSSYLWQPGGQTSASITVNPIVTSFYTVLITDSNSCSNTDTVKVTVRPVPKIYAGTDKKICIGGSIILSASGAATYVWNPGSLIGYSVTVSPTMTTNYIVTGTNSFGCSNTDTVQVTVNPLPSPNAGPDQTICSGSTTSISASGGNSYLWNTGSTVSTIFVNPTSHASYNVTVTDANGCINYDTVEVFVNPSPVVLLQNGFICQGNSIILDAGNPGATYLWNPGGDTTQTIAVNTAGTYSVIVTNSLNCQAIGYSTVNMGGTGLVSNLTPAVFCDGGSAVLDAGNPGSSYLWSTGSVSQVITVTQPGAYTVTVTDISGCSSVFNANVTVNPLPQVGFTASPVCENAPTGLLNNSSISSGTIANWNWDFGDGTTSTDQQPSHQFNSPGNYTVTLTATSSNGCQATSTQNIVIHPKPAGLFVSNVVCLGDPTVFQDYSTASNGSIISWNWSFGDSLSSASSNPQHVYTIAGSYQVTLIVTTSDGCSDTVISSADVNPVPLADFSATEICQGAATVFTDISTISQGSIDAYDWDFGDGGSSILQNPSHLYITDGQYNTRLIVTTDQGCSDTIIKPVLVHPTPDAYVSVSSICISQPALFTANGFINSGSIQNWYWEFGDSTFSGVQNPQHTYSAPGSYSVLLVAVSDKGCRDSVTQSLSVFALPEVGFTHQDVCLNNLMQFTDTSASASGIISWNWDFGDGAVSTAQNPIHGYIASGSFPVTLTVSTADGCSQSLTQTVNVFPNPAANFSTGNVCLGSSTAFFDQTTLHGGGAINCFWDFNDGFTSTDNNPVHTYSSAGLYQVTLTSTSLNGCSSSVTLPVEVYPLPSVQFDAPDVCINSMAIFTDLSAVSNGSPVTQWSWSLGDSSFSSAQHPIHSYASPGTYQVTLTATSLNGCSNSLSDSIRIFPVPVASILAFSGCITEPVTLMNGNDPQNLEGNSYNWDFGDGNTSVLINPQHQYAVSGTYLVTLEVTNGYGCKTTTTFPVVVNPLPDADFSASNACAGENVQFINQSTISSGTIISYSWNFGNGQVSNQTNPQVQFAQPGTYTITLIVISDFGCSDTASTTITIYPDPVSNFSALNNIGCGPLPVYFSDSSFVQSGMIVAWSWNFGDGGSDSVQNPVHIYQHSGTYPVSLTVTSNYGCSQTYTLSNVVTVHPEPTAGFIPSPPKTNILNPVITFLNTSIGANFYQWNFGDGNTSGQVTPTHTYQDTGWYEVQLLVINEFGCLDTITKWIYIEPITTVFIPNTFTPNSDGVNDVFTVKGINILDVKLTIWNRWGDKIFLTENGFSNPWDGSVQGSSHQAKEDVYVYEALVLDIFRKQHRYVGKVNLVR